MADKKPRKKATSKMVSYANGISQTLGLGFEFTPDDSLFDVSKFIRTYKSEFEKHNDSRLASIRQIDYANTISDICNIGVYFDENSNSKEVSEFIRRYKEVYNNAIWRKSICEHTGIEEYNDIPIKSMLFICDNLYRKHGLYSFIGDNEEILYIGKSVDISQRIPSSYKERRNGCNIKKIMYYTSENMADVNVLEILLIVEYKPKLNTESNTDDTPTMFHSGIDIIRDFHEIPYFDEKRTEVSA